MRVDRKKGKGVVPSTPEEKIQDGVVKGVSSLDEIHQSACWPTDVEISRVEETKISEGKSRYVGKGTFLLNRQRHKDNMILNPQKMQFSVTVEDVKDSWGIPDIVVQEFVAT